MKKKPVAMALLWAMAGLGNTLGQAEGQSIDPSKKIILMGGGHRRPGTLLRDLERMEKLGAFDGIAVYPPQALHGARRDVIGRLFRTGRHDIGDFGEAIADLQAVRAKATRFKHNFLLAHLTTGVAAIDPPDWFDPEFDAVVHNWKVAADFCKRSGLMGIMFDDEVYYGADLWTYRGIGLKYHGTKSAKEYADQAFLRGAQIMRAINQVFPDIKILSLHGPGEGHGDQLGDFDAAYGLMRAFFDGLLSECTGQAQIIDGYERAYGFRSASDYAAARRLMKEDMRDISRVPAKFERYFRVAFPFYIGGYRQYSFDGDYENVDGLLRGEAEGYYYTPEEFEYSLYQALEHTDEYVWVYTDGRCQWWDREEDGIYIAQAYRDALERVRGRVPALPKRRKLAAYAAPRETAAATALEGGPISESKKIIMFGSGRRNPRGFRQDVGWLEEMAAFDGVTLYPALHREDGTKSEALGRLFRTDRLRIEDMAVGIADVQAAQAGAKRFEDNFLLTYLTTGQKSIVAPDWFDPEFDAVVHNWKVAADFCKRTGLAGILFSDSAWYGTNPWTYGGLKYEETRTAREYADQAFKRGAQIMRAINEVHPDLHIVFINGPAESRGARDDGAHFALLRAFVDGLLSECTGNARITGQMGLDYRSPVSFAAARRFAEQTLRSLSRVREEQFDKHFRVAFALILSPQMPFDFSSENTGRNYYTPEEFEYALHQALRHTDEYVWVYNDRCDWWDKGAHGTFIPRGYRDALLAARQPHPDPPALRNPDPYIAFKPVSANTNLRRTDIASTPDGVTPTPHPLAFVPYDEKATFGDLWSDHAPLTELSSRWRFRADGANLGLGKGWSAHEFDDSGWLLIDSGLPWDEHGYRAYDGYGWYRQTLRAPALPAGKKIYLAFGAVAHGAEVYVNGHLAGQHNMDGWAYAFGDPWKKRFRIDVTELLAEGRDNTIAVRVVDYGPWGGGIWKPVKLVAEK